MKETTTGKILTLVILGAAIYISVKNYKSKEFWYGMGALFLLGTSVHTYKKSVA